jgi:hypothetical protein
MDGFQKFILSLAAVVVVLFVYFMLFATGISIAITLALIAAFTVIITSLCKMEIDYRCD